MSWVYWAFERGYLLPGRVCLEFERVTVIFERVVGHLLHKRVYWVFERVYLVHQKVYFVFERVYLLPGEVCLEFERGYLLPRRVNLIYERVYLIHWRVYFIQQILVIKNNQILPKIQSNLAQG